MATLRSLLRAAPLLLLALLVACATAPPPGPAAPVQKPPEQPVPVPPAAKPPQPPAPRPVAPSAAAAWQPLLAKAEQATQRGDYEEALALLERAQRIEPDSGEVYLCMARTHKARGDTEQARATAERGLLYCSSQSMCAALRDFTQ